MKPVNAYLGYDPSRVSRVNEIDSTIHSWESVLFQQGKSVMDFDLNVLQNILRNSIGSLANNIFDGSGFFKTPGFTVSNAGSLAMPTSCDINLYGRTIKVRGTTNAGLQKSSVYTPDTGNLAATAPFGNFFWLEFWYEEITPVTVQNEIISAGNTQKKTYQVDPYGGEENRNTATNPYNNIIDPIYGAETSRRVQLRWRIRSTKIASRTTNSLGFGPSVTTFGGNTEVVARGGKAQSTPNSDNVDTLSTYVFYRSSDYPVTESIGTSYENSVKNSLVDFSSPRDEYLYIAGRGTANDAKMLNTVDGRVYGIPICMAYHTPVNGTWIYDDLSHVVGIKTGSVIAGGSAQIGTHVHLLINEGYDGFDGDTGKRWDRITIATQQDPLLGRPNFPADMYLNTDDKTGNVGYVIPSRVLVQDAGTATLPSLTFYSATSTKSKKTGFSYLEGSNTDSLIVSVGATNIGQFFKDSTLFQTTKIRQWENSVIAENGLVVSGSIEASLDAFVQRRLIVGYSQSNDLTNPGLAGGTGLKIKVNENTIQILNGGSGYHVGDEVVVVNGSTTSTATVATLSSGTKQVSGLLSSTTAGVVTTVTFTCDVNSDVAGISNTDSISVVSSIGSITTSAAINVVDVSNDNNSFTISGISSIVSTPTVMLKIQTTLGARAGCVGTLSSFSPALGIGTYSPELATATKYRTSRIKQLRTSYIAAEKAILKSGIINGQTEQSSGVDITGNINANARVELRINSSVFDTTGSTTRNSYPKARSINFIKGPLINLSGEMIDSTDTFNLTISGALDAFNLSYDTLSPKYYFIAGRVHSTQPPTGTMVISGLPGDTPLSNNPFSVPNTGLFTISITVGLPSSTANDKTATVTVSNTITLTNLALAMENAIKILGTLTVGLAFSDVSVNGAEIRYSTNTGFSFNTKSSAVWKSITSNAALSVYKILEKIGVETNISVSTVRKSPTNPHELSFYDDDDNLASIAPGMIVSDATPGIGNTKLSYLLQHMTAGFSNPAQFKFTCVEGELKAVSEITVAGSGYKVGDVLTINGNAGGIRGSVRVTEVTTINNIPGIITQATVFSGGSNYPVTLNAFSTTRQNFIEVVSVSTSAPTVIVNYSLAEIVTPIDVVFSSSITTTGNEQKTFINSGDRYLSPAAQLIRNDQTAQSNYMKRASLPSDVWVEGRSSIAARRDHRHERERYQDTASAPLPPYISASTVGESLSVSRGDHTHGWPSAIPVGVSFGAPPADTDGSVAGGRRVGTATEFFGLTGPIGKQRDNLIASKSTNPAALRGADALKSALAIWDTDFYNAQIPNTTSEFLGYISAENRADGGDWLTITSGGTPGALVNGSTITVGGSLYEATSNIIIQNINGVERKYVTIRYPSPAQSSVVVLIPSSQPVPMMAKSPSAATGILPDVGGRIVFGGKVASGLDYAVFGGIRGGKVNNAAGDRNGYLSLEARQMEGQSTNNEEQLRYMTEFLRGYNSGHVVIGTIPYGYNHAASADLMAAENLLPTMGTLARKFRVTGKSLFEDGILMNKGKAEFTNIEVSSSPQDALVQIWSTNTTAQPMLSLMQRSVQSGDSISAPRIYEETNKNQWDTYLTRFSNVSGVGHYSIALDTLNTDNFDGIAMQFQRDTIGTSRSGTVNKVIMYPSAQIGSTLNNISQVKRTLTFQARNDSSFIAGSELGGMNWILSSNVIGGDRNNNYALRSFAISATPLNTSANQFVELSGGTTQVGKPGQPGTLSPNFQTFVLTDFSNASNMLLYNKRVDFDANVTVNGMELSPTATTPATSFLNTTPQNTFEVYQGTTGKPWRLGTYNKLANLSGTFTASTSGQSNTVLSLTGGTTYNGVYGFLAGQKFTIGLNTYFIQSVDYVAKTITLTASTSLSGSVVVTVEDVSGGLKGQFDRIANEYRLGFITRNDLLWNTGSIEFNDLHFRTGSEGSLKSKMYIANNGNVGIADNYFNATAAPLSLLHIHDSGTTSIDPTAAFGTLTLSHALSTGQSSIVFKSAVPLTDDPAKDYGYIKYQSNVGYNVERSRLTIGVGLEPRIYSDSATGQRKADDVFISASGSIVGQGSGVAGLFAPRVSIPAQSFSLPTATSALEVPLNQARTVGAAGDSYGITPVSWNRYELIYSDAGTNNTAVSQWADATISLPWNYTPGAEITARVIWYGDSPTTTISSARTGDVQWQLLIAVITPWISDAESGTVSTVHGSAKAPFSIGTVTSPVKWSTDVGAIFTETKFTWTPDSPSAILTARPGDLLGIRLRRNAGASADTFTGNAFVSNLILEFGNALGAYFTD